METPVLRRIKERLLESEHTEAVTLHPAGGEFETFGASGRGSPAAEESRAEVAGTGTDIHQAGR